MSLLLLAMKINIEFTEEQCNQLLEKHGYVVEKTTLYYNPETNPYVDDRECDPSLLRGLDYKVVYLRDHKPAELDKEYPLIDECRNYMYSNAVDKMMSNLFYNVMLHC